MSRELNATSEERFAEALRVGLGDKIKDDDVAKLLWSALANVEWYHIESHAEVGYSFRAAGALIADLRGEGDYLDWYCCAPDRQVSVLISHTLRKQGWIYDDIGLICDEPGCIEQASCGAPSDSGYRRTCFDHMPNSKPNIGAAP